MRLALLPALLLAACSPNPTPSPVAAPAPASPPVPFRQLGWDSDHFTWEGKPFTGTTTDHYKSGALKCRYGIRNGRYHGLVEEWHENGNPKTRTAYDDGRNRTNAAARHGGRRLYRRGFPPWHPTSCPHALQCVRTAVCEGASPATLQNRL